MKTMTETAIARTEELYARHITDRPFMVDLGLYLRHGFVVNFPDLFAMGRPVRSDANWLEIGDPSFAFEDPDAWFICMVTGELRKLARMLPFPLPYICFYRKWDEFKILKRYATATFMERCAKA